jgi:hypothetical protein
MNEVMLLKELLEKSGKAAPAMTNALKRLGSGSMQSGIIKIADMCQKSGIRIGTLRGAIGGAVGVAAVFAIIKVIRTYIDKNKQLKLDGEEIIKELEIGLSEYENDDTSDSLAEENDIKAITENNQPTDSIMAN